MPPEKLAAKVEQLEERLADVEQAHAEGEVSDGAVSLEEIALPVGGKSAEGI
ncbi:hypothetical protein J2Y48_003176 [Mycoplana sp. BE70]|uniref:hypothetical protein n=1 Tax=Mycoplana sp. BE70 TaxID=2817775 RepID=UPI002859C1B5|nr:hypothetical protein [Mycoplana sp. BE70]MDR6757879.1 hypothetical protein [Mycoplana sp. BE70]